MHKGLWLAQFTMNIISFWWGHISCLWVYYIFWSILNCDLTACNMHVNSWILTTIITIQDNTQNIPINLWVFLCPFPNYVHLLLPQTYNSDILISITIDQFSLLSDFIKWNHSTLLFCIWLFFFCLIYLWDSSILYLSNIFIYIYINIFEYIFE